MRLPFKDGDFFSHPARIARTLPVKLLLGCFAIPTTTTLGGASERPTEGRSYREIAGLELKQLPMLIQAGNHNAQPQTPGG